MAAGMAAGGLSPLADAGRADMGNGRLSENRFSGHVLLCFASEEEGAEFAR